MRDGNEYIVMDIYNHKEKVPKRIYLYVKRLFLQF